MLFRFFLCLIFGVILGVALNAATGSGSQKHAAAVRTDAWPLHHGATFKVDSRGPRVATLQYLLRDPRPAQNAFTKVKGTLKPHTFTRGIYDLPTARALIAYKFRIGYPARGQCGAHSSEWRVTKVGPYFFELLRGHRNRPACWVAVAAKRLAAAVAGATPAALKLKAIELTQVGVYEPLAYYRYNNYFGLPFEAWCAIFQGWSMRHITPQLPLLAPTNPWYVPNIINWGRSRGYLTATAKVGEWVLYYGDISHIGYVISVDPKTGFYWSVEGNYANHVAQVQHSPYDHLHYFLAVPGVA